MSGHDLTPEQVATDALHDAVRLAAEALTPTPDRRITAARDRASYYASRRAAQTQRAAHTAARRPRQEPTP